jgi:hypothetical protein
VTRPRRRRLPRGTSRCPIAVDFRLVHATEPVPARSASSIPFHADVPPLAPDEQRIVVERVIPTCRQDTLPGKLMWELALDQRAFGPRRVLVACADRDGTLLELAHSERTDPPELAFGLCLRTADPATVAAVAYCDEPVDVDASEAELDATIDRYLEARRFAADHLGVHLVDWIACDDQVMRSFRLLYEPDADLWAIP